MTTITLGAPLATLQAQLCAQIDAGAEAVRASFITLGAGQAMVYEQKLREAERIMANTVWDEGLGEDVTTVPAYEVPNLTVEAQDLGVSLLAAAQAVVEAAYLWAGVSAVIESKRLGHKRLVMAANSHSAARAAAQVDWSLQGGGNG